MPINILMPALSPTMEKGNLAKWLKKEGDRVKSGDILAEIETDKATMEYEAIDEGVIAKILVAEGTADVPVNQPIAVLVAEGEDAKPAGGGGAAKPAGAPGVSAAPGGGSPHPAPSAPPSPKPGRDGGASGVSPSYVAGTNAEAGTHPSPVSGRVASAASRVGSNGHGGVDGHAGRVFASPLARRLAKAAGIEIGQIAGSGPHGRIIARDVEVAKAGGAALRAPAGPVPAPATAAPGIAPGPALSDKATLDLFKPGTYDLVPHDNMRKIIAQRLTLAKQAIPHYYLTVSCTIDKLLAAREEINAAAPNGADGKPAWKVSVNDFVIKALGMALIKIPEANVTWTEAAMLRHKHADIGVAVAMPGGLITPIVRSAETKSITAISREMKDFATRGRARKLRPEEYQGGASAISNLGMYGIEEFTAVINPPQSTILAVGAGEQRAVVRNGQLAIATQMNVTLSCDHRAVDGAVGAELIGAFKLYIESPMAMLA
jgi:pyruvate dehydrogenase E2 component (dihydrolipoamide acetyltransferase)